ncbi:MAG: hypothetical protein R6V54_09325 [Desulfobacteraceae bacterium]
MKRLDFLLLPGGPMSKRMGAAMQVLKIDRGGVCALVLFAVFAVAGCDNKEDGDYSGVGKLVSDRNKARMSHAEGQSGRAVTEQSDEKPDTALPKKRRSRGDMVFEEKIKIVNSSSGKILAEGTAFLDKSGRIVNIRIRRD